MITMKEWKEMCGREQTAWLEENAELSRRSESKRGLVRRVGMNDAHYCAKPIIDGVKLICPAYQAWEHMLERSYSAKYHAKRQTYSGVTVCEEWRPFSSFRSWWLANQVDGWQIDKDLVGDGKLYSPDTCIFVPAWLNSFTTDSGASRGEWPIGVCYQKGRGRFQALCRNPASKKQEHLGYFGTPYEAHLAWRTRKLELALELKPKMDEIDIRIYARVVEIINNAK